MSLVRTFYVSQSAVQPSALEAEVDQIIATSVRNNGAAKVTGMLLVHDGWFLQALEGPDRAVEATLDRIRRDRRHRTVKVLGLAGARDRLFSQWAMCARTLAQVDAEILATLDARGVRLDHINPASAERLLLLVASIRGAAAERTAAQAA